MIVNLDTSAALKILIDEPGMTAMRESFTAWQLRADDVVSSFLLHSGMHCAARRGGFAGAEVIDALLGGVGPIDIDRSHLLAAARDPHALRSAESIHLATAVSSDADLLVAYDRVLATAAEREGIRPVGPGL